MDNTYNTPISRKNKHLNAFERGQIQLLHLEGLTAYAIGKRLHRSSNTIRNELKRGTVSQRNGKSTFQAYFPETGQLVYEQNRLKCGPKFKFLQCTEFINHVSTLFFNDHLSLDSICGVSKVKELFQKDEMVCTRTLYNYVDKGLLTISNLDLPLKLKRNTKHAQVRKNKKLLGTSISERPEIINNRLEFGHWEIDTVIGKKGKLEPVLLTLTERTTRAEIIKVISNKTAKAVQIALDEIRISTGEYFSNVFKSITSDNGSEFADLSTLESITDTKIYFAHPYTSCERGTNERHNGLIRRFIPKGKSITEYSLREIARIQNWCNDLPRKILKYLTPREALQIQLNKIIKQ